MFEYDIETISRILKIEEFDLEKLNLNEVKHVPMHQYRTTSKEKPLLLIENLQVCFALYAYSKNFGFAAHLNPVIIRGNEFQCDENKNIIFCNRINDLFNSVINSKIEEPVYIGISIGTNPVSETYKQIRQIGKTLDYLILKLNKVGIEARKLNLQNNHIFILDVTNGKIITPSSKNIKVLTRTK